MADSPGVRDEGAPLVDPFAGGARKPARSLSLPGLAMVVFAAGIAVSMILGVRAITTPPPASTSVVTVRATPDLLVAVRELSRLETADVHVEKVIDLTDTQSHLFGLVEATDALLLVAVGDATLGVDLSKLGPGDISMDEATKTAHLRLPPPELFRTTLDEKSTYVYARTTSLLARRNEQLEGKARRAAVDAIEEVARKPDMMGRARAQAERQLTALVKQLGAEKVEIAWRE
ncbi:MAG: DUF4230 domain-containing protein [Polyangiaceae bacterium]